MAPGLGVATAIGAAGWMAQRNERCLPALEASDGDGDRSIDVVVPARNEAAAIVGCVRALLASPGVAGMTVVDDGSTDGTAAAAAEAGAIVVRTEGPPQGWRGKPHACHRGARAGTAPWIAFVDADVRLEPWALSSIARLCQEHGLAAASPLLQQRCTGLADRMIVPLAFWQYLVGLPGKPRPRPPHGDEGGVAHGEGHPAPSRRRARAILNGQCLVVRRDAYERTGGHGHVTVRASVAEDSALAQLLAGEGHRVELVRSVGAGTVAMYRDLREVRNGFGKNVAAFLEADPWRGALVALAGIALTASPGLALRAVRRRSGCALTGALAAYGAGCAALARPYREAGEPAATAAGHPLAAAAMQAIAIESLARRLLGLPWQWRGRAVA